MSVVAWGPTHHIMSFSHYNRPIRRSTMGWYGNTLYKIVWKICLEYHIYIKYLQKIKIKINQLYQLKAIEGVGHCYMDLRYFDVLLMLFKVQFIHFRIWFNPFLTFLKLRIRIFPLVCRIVRCFLKGIFSFNPSTFFNIDLKFAIILLFF